jgi:hypothetical protein
MHVSVHDTADFRYDKQSALNFQQPDVKLRIPANRKSLVAVARSNSYIAFILDEVCIKCYDE